ncbi:MAG: hypothetical protein LBU99_04075, partial [Spirochaetaceae bacterium]|nr:hypothetical protein [Spirochaetaceae bacterium]
MALKPFRSVRYPRTGRSVFDLSHEVKLDADPGKLYPVLCEPMLPGDHFRIGSELTLRCNPFIAPLLHEINVYVHHYFVPYRILWSDWERFITGGEVTDQRPPILAPPLWDYGNSGEQSLGGAGTLWDYLGFELNLGTDSPARPSRFPQSAYLAIYNEYYRDANLILPFNPEKPSIAVAGVSQAYNGKLLYRSWSKDYFTSALPWQQRGVSPVLPIDVSGQVIFNDGNILLMPTIGVSDADAGIADRVAIYGGGSPSSPMTWSEGRIEGPVPIPTGNMWLKTSATPLNANELDATATGIDINELREAIALQRYRERDARIGSRYVEFLRGRYGIAPRDETLQRPQYLGGMRTPIIVSEVLQTSSSNTTSPQGNLAGHGIAVDINGGINVTAREFGLVMGIMSIMPTPAYTQGIDRKWIQDSKYDFFAPEFVHLSERPIYLQELIYVPGHTRDIFGYQGMYDEFRISRNKVVGKMRTDYAHWHMAREFTGIPTLSKEFIELNVDTGPDKAIKRPWAVPAESAFLINFGNR